MDKPPAERPRPPTTSVRPRLDNEPIECFIEKLQAAAGTVRRVDTVSNVPQAISDYLAQHGLERRVVLTQQPELRELLWPEEWNIHYGPATGEDHISVCAAFAGVAETGTLMMLSGIETPTTLNFLPDDHVVLVRTTQIVPHFEDAWLKLCEQDAPMPRTVNLITGPSRTADVEQTIQLGAHGPRRLHVVLIDD